MRFKIVWFTAVLLALHAFTASRVWADPLRIQSGFVFLSEGGIQSFGLDFGLNGDGFVFVGEDTDTFDYLADFSPSESPFRLRFSGVPDPSSNSSCLGCDYTGDFLFRFMPFTGSSSSAFTMSGLLTGFAAGSAQPTITAELVGRGRMTAGDNVLFQFEADAAPIPEPSTLLLLGTGTALVLRRRRR
jgi:hypothetical protein